MFSTNFRFVSSIIIHVNFMNPVILKAFNITKLYISFEDKSIKQLNTAYYINSCLYVHNLQINTPNLPRFFRTFELDRLSSLSWIKFYDIILILIFITINKKSTQSFHLWTFQALQKTAVKTTLFSLGTKNPRTAFCSLTLVNNAT